MPGVIRSTFDMVYVDYILVPVPGSREDSRVLLVQQQDNP